MQALLEFPWDKLAAFFGAAIGFITLSAMVMPRLSKFRKWIGSNVQDILGIGELRSDVTAHMESVNRWIESHSEQAKERDDAIARLATVIGKYVGQARKEQNFDIPGPDEHDAAF